VLEYDDVYKTFDTPVLQGVSLRIEPGERLGIVGPSGTGKSVLLKMAIGLIEPDRGEVRAFALPLVHGARKNVRAARERIGYVFQNAALFDSMTVHDNIAYGIHEADRRRLAKTEVEARVRRSLQDVNLDADAIVNKLPSELSGGMRKRVGLARTLIGRPEVILYDEPVTGLDPVNTALVTNLIIQLSQHSTSVVVSHDVEGTLRFCHRIALLAHGNLVFIGTPDAFRTSDDPLVRAFAHRDAATEAALALSEHS
jgi:phospholipid/cholesterol/gamma-HCH transport system ATP-binding protein